jgi:hypothetical protein
MLIILISEGQAGQVGGRSDKAVACRYLRAFEGNYTLYFFKFEKLKH